MSPPAAGRVFVIARNPETDSTLPYLLLIPVEEGLVLKARDTWPRSARIYCHPFEDGLPEGAASDSRKVLRSLIASARES